MKKNKAIVIISATFRPQGMHTPEFKEYSRRSNANGEAHGGKVLQKFKVLKNLGGGALPHMVMVVEYPSLEHAESTFNSKEYKAILPLRDAALSDVNILTTESINK